MKYSRTDLRLAVVEKTEASTNDARRKFNFESNSKLHRHRRKKTVKRIQKVKIKKKPKFTELEKQHLKQNLIFDKAINQLFRNI